MAHADRSVSVPMTLSDHERLESMIPFGDDETCTPSHVLSLNFGHSRSNHTSVIMEIPIKLLLSVPPSKVTQCHWNQHQPTNNYGPISHRFQWRYCKICPPPCI